MDTHKCNLSGKSEWRLARKLADIKFVINSLKYPYAHPAQPYVAYERYLMKSHKANANDYDDNGNERQGERE